MRFPKRINGKNRKDIFLDLVLSDDNFVRRLYGNKKYVIDIVENDLFNRRLTPNAHMVLKVKEAWLGAVSIRISCMFRTIIQCTYGTCDIDGLEKGFEEDHLYALIQNPPDNSFLLTRKDKERIIKTHIAYHKL